jgi:hypothetical protein
MSAAFVLVIVVALLCVALAVLFGVLWAALHFGVATTIDPLLAGLDYPHTHIERSAPVTGTRHTTRVRL